MIEYLSSAELSLYSLLFVFAIPFWYFGYQAKYSGNRKALAWFDFILFIVSGVVAVGVGINVVTSPYSSSMDYRLLAILHFAPIATVLLAIQRIKSISKSAALKLAEESIKLGASVTTEKTTRKSLAVLPDLSWESLVLSLELKEDLLALVEVMKDPQTAVEYGVEVPRGIIIQGPPGTGKTTLAGVIASSAGMKIVPVAVDELVSMSGSDLESAFSELMNESLDSEPKVLLLDRLEAVSKAKAGGAIAAADNVKIDLLKLIDQVVSAQSAFVVAVTSRSELIEDVFIRPDRLARVVEIDLPDFEQRRQIFWRCLSKLTLEEDLNIDVLAQYTEGASGATIWSICNQAGLNAFKRESNGSKASRNFAVTAEDLRSALIEYTAGGAVVDQARQRSRAVN